METVKEKKRKAGRPEKAIKKEVRACIRFSKVEYFVVRQKASRATVALFLLVCLLTTGWYMTSTKLDLYRANDTKYRYLKLQPTIGLRQWCRGADSLYTVDENMRATVLAREEEKQRKLETLQRATEMEEEARKLKEQVNGRKRNEDNLIRKKTQPRKT